MLDLKKDIKDIQDNKITSLDYRNINISNTEGLENYNRWKEIR